MPSFRLLAALLILPLLPLLPMAAAQELPPADAAAVQALIAKFADPDPFVNGDAAAALAAAGEAAVPQLTAALQSADENSRWCAAIALEKMTPAGKGAIAPLTGALQESSANVRWCAALALGKYGSAASGAAAALQKLLHDDDRDVRWAAAAALRRIDPKTINRPPETAQVIARIEQLAPPLMQELHVPGLSICLIEKEQLLWSKNFGLADAGRTDSVTSATIFEACSMSKPVFAWLVLKLADDGRIDLDTPLSRYRREEFVSLAEDSGRQITARMVLSHSSGLPNWRKGGEERGGPLPLYFQPGLKFGYSGEGIYYLQRVIEQITGEPLERLARRLLFEPLGLKESSFLWSETLSPLMAAGHDNSGQPLPRSRYLHANGAYTLYTTAEEYARLMTTMLGKESGGGPVLSNKMRQEMVQHQLRMDTREVTDRPGRYLGVSAWRGLGWAIDATITRDILYHSGANQTGFRCYCQYNREEGSGIVIMTNSLNGSELWSRLISAVGDY